MSDPNYVRESRKQLAARLKPRHITARLVIPIDDEGKQVDYKLATRSRTIDGQRTGEIVKAGSGQTYRVHKDGSVRRVTSGEHGE
jgi:hypothetical protein